MIALYKSIFTYLLGFVKYDDDDCTTHLNVVVDASRRVFNGKRLVE